MSHRSLVNLFVSVAALWTFLFAFSFMSVAEPILGENPPAVAEGEPQVTDLAKAHNLFKAEDTAGALQMLRQAVKKNPDLPPAQVLMAELYAQAAKLPEAKQALETAIREVPKDPHAYVFLAELLMSERKRDEAEGLCQKALSLMSAVDKNPERKALLQASANGTLATAAEARQDWASAQKLLEVAATSDPKNGVLVQRLAYARFRQKNIDGALQALRTGAKNRSLRSSPEIILAQFFQQANDGENAKKWINAAIVAAPKDVDTRLAASQWALMTGQLDEAQKHAVAATRIDPKSLDAKLSRGVIAMFQKDYETAEACFQSLFERIPGDFVASNNLALALIEQGVDAKNHRALELAEGNVKKFPKLAAAVSTHGWVLYKLGRLDDAEKALQTAASLGNLSADTSYYAARVKLDRGRKDEARQLLETALKSPLFLYKQEAEELLESLK